MFTHLLLLQILMIQACQQYGQQTPVNSSQDAREGCPADSRYITLKRPHTLLLMSTVSGGSAERGAYTCAFVEQTAKADGVTSITDMEARARTEMLKTNPNCEGQVPEARTTLMKPLVLPAI